MTLHTRYRPQSWKEVVGQSAVKRSFSEALKKGTSRAFLLVGPSGTGKTTCARIAAREVGCADGSITEIDAATFTGIDDMRVVTNGLQYRPLNGERKAIILDEAHRLSAAAWASLLKSIEEPPPWVYWFLCTTELGKVPATIQTRCTRYELEPCATDAIYDLLADVARKEKLQGSEGVLELCAKRAQGSPRQALVNLGAVASAASPEDARALLRAVEGSKTVIDLCRALLDRKPWASVLPILNDLKDQNGESIRHAIREYMTKVALGAKEPKRAGNAIEILDEFSTPFPSGDGISPVVVAVGRLTLGE